MKVSLKWLKEYVAIGDSPAELARKITLAGTEVAHIDARGGWQNVMIGEVVGIQPHPQADRLRLATVSLGSEQETVVCGAPNLTLGDRVAFARVGAELIDGHTGAKTVLKPAVIRGISSAGMICSEKELGLSQSHEGILVLPSDAPLGASLADYMGDVIFDLEVTPNRPDMLSMLGVAHEVGALTGTAVGEPVLDYAAAGDSIETMVSVEIRDTELCPRYSVSLVTGVRVGESPAWLKERLAAGGVRSINNVVDITNYVMLEYGQPLHAFDFDKITDGRVIARCAREGEEMTTLDGIARRLIPGTLVIADPMRPVAVAGVMGGDVSEVDGGTTSVLLESASFKPASIHRTVAALKLGSEASRRFERGISPLITLPALKRATQLMVELSGGTAAAGVIDCYPGQEERSAVALSLSEVKRILGMSVEMPHVSRILTSLGFEFREGPGDEFAAVPPYWRSDIRIPADVIEEIARIIGYADIPYSRLPSALPESLVSPMIEFKRRARVALKGFGGSEVITYAFASEETLSRGLNCQPEMLPLRVANPMNPDQGCMRTSLRGNLLQVLAANIRREEGPLFIFELGRVYLRRAQELPEEPEMLCILLASAGPDKRWHGRKEAVDFYDAKGLMEGLLGELRIEATFVPGHDPGLRPGAQAAIMADGVQIGVLGELYPEVARAFDLPAGVYLCEFNLSAALPLVRDLVYRTLPRFPGAERDLALVVDETVAHHQIVDIIEQFRLVTGVRLFDVYAGSQLAPGKKSLGYNLSFQSPDHTLKDAEVDGVLGAIVSELGTRLGAVLRT
ncbi:MAG: phenylalanine--tRNA ligase subunit beta [Dehalococcoidia bacterium]|nr:phenylalanine--tRNA ligase subunit beta [Dehalococcoidia bacterium]